MVALVQEAAGAAPAVHGELVVEAVGEAAAGAQLPTSHCCCGILLPSSTIVTSSYIFTSPPVTCMPWAGGWVESGSWCWVEAGSQGPGGHDRELEMWPGAGWLGRNMVSISSMSVRAGNEV